MHASQKVREYTRWRVNIQNRLDAMLSPRFPLLNTASRTCILVQVPSLRGASARIAVQRGLPGPVRFSERILGDRSDLGLFSRVQCPPCRWVWVVREDRTAHGCPIPLRAVRCARVLGPSTSDVLLSLAVLHPSSLR